MRMSQNFTKTRKEAPAEEVARNAQLLIRAGFVFKVMAGVYAYTPLGLRVVENIKQVVREEINAIGGQELIMSTLQHQSTWEKTGRWDDEVVDIWFKSELKDGTEIGLAWSHEETIIEMLQEHLESYKDLPINVYQFQNKMRNELRAKSGIMRGREFVMKDAYTCCVDEKQHDKVYQDYIDAYLKIFERLGLGKDTFLTYASGGAFTQFSHEFQTVCAAGEDTVFYAPQADKYFNSEIAPSLAPEFGNSHEEMKEREDVEGKGIVGVKPLSEFLEIPIELTTKTMLYEDENGDVVAAAVRGGYDISEDKLKHVSGASFLKLASQETVERVTGADVGYAGILDLPADVRLYMDDSMKGRRNFETGANKTNHHSINVNFGRDIDEPDTFYDIKQAKEGDRYPETGEEYQVLTTAEVGNIFNFGTQKSKEMDFSFTNEAGEKQFVHLGSYGIGVTRAMGVIAEKFSDDAGLIWPEIVAPFQVHVVRIGDAEAVVEQADSLYQKLTEMGVETVYDDRNERVGAMLADADLMGMPTRVVVSEKSLDKGGLEVKRRAEADSSVVSVDEFLTRYSNK